MIRLAWHQGLLTQPDLNSYQRFAAIYHIHAQRRREVKDINDTLEKQTWYQHPDRYNVLFSPDTEYVPEHLTIAGRDVEEVVDDIDEMDAYFDNLENQRSLTGAQLFGYVGDENGWV